MLSRSRAAFELRARDSLTILTFLREELCGEFPSDWEDIDVLDELRRVRELRVE